MTNAYFTPAVEGFIAGEIDLDTAVIKCALVRGYTFSAAHKFISDVVAAGGTINGTSGALTTKTVTGGTFDADDSSIVTVANATNHVLILFQSSVVGGGADVAQNAQRLIAYYDTGTGLPIQPGTGTVPVAWDNGANKILKVG